MGEQNNALELWERSVEQINLATAATRAALKLFGSASASVAHDAWDSACSARAALRSAIAEEEKRFAALEDTRRQTEMDFERKAGEEAAARESGAAVEPDGVRLLPQETMPLDDGTVEAFEDPDRLIDEDDAEANAARAESSEHEAEDPAATGEGEEA